MGTSQGQRIGFQQRTSADPMHPFATALMVVLLVAGAVFAFGPRLNVGGGSLSTDRDTRHTSVSDAPTTAVTGQR